MIKINIIIPCYNEEKRLPLSEYAAYYAARPDISFCFINDGSSDNTLSLLKSLARDREDRISVLSLMSNVGKAEAVRTGILHVLQEPSIDYVGFMDADLATPLSEIDGLISCCIDFPATSILFGSRIKRPDAQITRSPMRHYLGRLFAASTKLFLGIKAYDTQCGAKLMRASIAREIFREPFISRWLFDVELFLRATALASVDPDSIIEFPLCKWTEKGSSRLGIKDAAAIMRDFIRIRYKYRREVRRKKGMPMIVRRAECEFFARMSRQDHDERRQRHKNRY